MPDSLLVRSLKYENLSGQLGDFHGVRDLSEGFGDVVSPSGEA